MRDLKIDSLKGFAIVAVIIGHLCVLTSGITTANENLWLNIDLVIETVLPVYYFHIPLFFAMSILFVKEFSIKFLKKRFVQILVPYFLWYLYFNSALFKTNPLSWIKNALYGNWEHLESILWFLPALFTINIYYSLYKKYPKKLYIFLLIWIVVFIFAEPIAAKFHTDIPFGIDLAFYLFPYLLIIDNVYKYKNFFIKINNWYSLILIPLYALFIYLITYFEPIKTFTPYHHRIDLAQFSVPFTIIGFISMTLLSCIIIIFFLRIKELKSLSIVGKYSMPIYLLHLVILGKLVPVYNNLALSNEFLFALLMILSIPLTILITIIISKILRSISYYTKYLGMVE